MNKNISIAALADIKRQLRKMVDELELSVERQLETDREEGHLDAGGNDRSDIANHALEVGMDITQTSRSAYQLTLAENALKKMNEGKYGSCEDCGGAISAKRLVANPIARRCISCQADQEKMQTQQDQTPSL